MKLRDRVIAGFLEATILVGGILAAATVFGDAAWPGAASTWAGLAAIWLAAGVLFSWLVHVRSTAFRAQRGGRTTRYARREGRPG